MYLVYNTGLFKWFFNSLKNMSKRVFFKFSSIIFYLNIYNVVLISLDMIYYHAVIHMNDWLFTPNFKLYNVVLVTKTYFPLSVKNNLKNHINQLKAYIRCIFLLTTESCFRKDIQTILKIIFCVEFKLNYRKIFEFVLDITCIGSTISHSTLYCNIYKAVKRL